MEKLVHDLETTLIPLSEDALSTLDEDITSYKKNMDEIKQSAKERIQSLIQQLVKAEEIFLTEMDILGEKDLKIMEMKKREMNENITRIKSAVAKGKSAPVDASLSLLKDEIFKISTMNPSQITCTGKLSFNVSSYQLPTVHVIIGSVSNGAEKIVFKDASQARPEIIMENSLDNIKVDVNILRTIEGISATAIMHLNNNQTWICNKNDESMIEYDEHFSRTRNINIGFTCYDMAMDGSRDVIGTDWTNRRIVRIAFSGSITQICSTAPMISYGMCVNNKQQIVVGVRGLKQHSTLVVYSSDGSSVLQDINYGQSNKQLFTGRINRVRQTASGDYVVADESRIICLSTEWNVKWTYEFEQKRVVLAVYCDMYNSVLVGFIDKNEIVMLNRDGQLIRTLLTKDNGICGPWSMDVDS